jgi:hypothetical protein
MMSAPGSLACSKLLYPETEESTAKNIDELELPPRFLHKQTQNHLNKYILDGIFWQKNIVFWQASFFFDIMPKAKQVSALTI